MKSPHLQASGGSSLTPKGPKAMYALCEQRVILMILFKLTSRSLGKHGAEFAASRMQSTIELAAGHCCQSCNLIAFAFSQFLEIRLPRHSKADELNEIPLVEFLNHVQKFQVAANIVCWNMLEIA